MTLIQNASKKDRKPSAFIENLKRTLTAYYSLRFLLSNESLDDDEKVVSEIVTPQPVPDRRRLLRTLATLAGLGITGALLSQREIGPLPTVSADTTNGSVAFYSSGSITGDNSEFFWDDTNHRLGIGTSSPSQLLHIVGNTTNPHTSLAENLRVESSAGEVGIGLNNSGSSGHFWIISSTGEPTFEGPGELGFYDNTAGAWRMTLGPTGNVGIGTTTPSQLLHLYQGSGATIVQPETGTNTVGDYAGFVFVQGGSTIGKLYTNQNNVNYQAFSPTGKILFLNSSGGIVAALTSTSLGIGTTAPDQALSVMGNADKSSGGTSWGVFCDRRWKDEASMQPFTPGLEWVRSLPTPVRFRYAKDNGIGANPEEKNVNFIAQDLLDGVHDELVYSTRAKIKKTDKELSEAYGVNVNDMHFAMVNAIKELAEKLERLEAENDALRKEIKQQSGKRLAAS